MSIPITLTFVHVRACACVCVHCVGALRACVRARARVCVRERKYKNKKYLQDCFPKCRTLFVRMRNRTHPRNDRIIEAILISRAHFDLERLK